MKTTELPRWASAIVMPLLNLLTALLVAGLVIRLLGESPFESLAILIEGSVLTASNLGYTLFYATTFIFTGLSVSIAMKAGLFNIGSEGQMYVGGLGLTLAMLWLDDRLPALALIPVAIAASALFGALWAFLPGYLQAKRGSHVVVTTIMFNFIAAALMNYAILKMIPAGSQNTASREFAEAGALPRLSQWFTDLADAPLNIAFLMALFALLVYGVLVWRSPWGYKLRATGLNAHAAHYAGVSIGVMIIVVMLVSGALAGLGAVNSIMGSTHYLSLSFPAGAGFIGIAVALMGRQHPVGILLSSVLFGALIQGAGELSFQKPGIPVETLIFIQGLIILFCGAMDNLYARPLLKLLNAGKK
jgi:ABC-type uncharacterized transport system permease subunit